MIPQITRRAFFLAILAAALFYSPSAFAYDRRVASSLTHCIMGGFFEKLGDIDKAAQEYIKGLKADPQNAHLHLNLAGACIKQGNIQKAMDELNLAIKYDPEAVEPHAVLALLYFSQNKSDDAGKEYEHALQKAAVLEPKNVSIYKSLGLLYLERKDYAAAEKTFKLVVELTPSDAEAYFYLANITDELKRRGETEGYLKKSLELNPDFHQALNYLGFIYVEEGRELDQAKKLIDRALVLDPENGAYIDSRGWFFFKKGEYAEAVKDLEKASLLIEDPVVFDHLGDTYLKLRDNDKARKYWEKALALDPTMAGLKTKIDSLKAK